MKIVISALHFAWATMEQCLSRATREFGLDGVELSWHSDFVRGHCTQQDIEYLAALPAGQRPILMSHIWEDLAHLGLPAARQAMMGWLDLSVRTHVSGLVIHGGAWPDRREGIRRTRIVLEDILPAFEQARVVLNLENHYAFDYRNCNELFSEPWEFVEVLDLDSPSLAFCFDTGHGHMTHNWRELLSRLGRCLRHVHLADNHGIDDDHCPYGLGNVPFDDMLEMLKDIRFDGTFCVEFPARENLEPFHKCIAKLRHLWPAAK